MAEKQLVEYEITDKALKGATQVSRDLWGPFDVTNDRFQVPIEAVDSFSAEGSGFKVRDQKQLEKLLTARLEDTPFPFAPAKTEMGTAVIMNLPDGKRKEPIDELPRAGLNPAEEESK